VTILVQHAKKAIITSIYSCCLVFDAEKRIMPVWNPGKTVAMKCEQDNDVVRQSAMQNLKNFSAFTLVELLVVIAIIGILAAMLLVVFSSAVNSAKSAKAKTEMSSLVTAIQGYDEAYGRYPVSTAVQNLANAANSDFTYGGSLLASYAKDIGPGNYTTNNSEVIAILMDITNYPGGGWTVNTNHLKNPQRTIFLNPHMSGDTNSPGVGTDLVYRDPWGNPYVITMDLNYNEVCEDAFYKLPTVSTNGANGLILQPDGNYAYRGTIMVWSAGHNQSIDPDDPANDHENHDNVLSWQ
jgi:prepilin-type N-terminal cleavage/methylation domain-containing protein